MSSNNNVVPQHHHRGSSVTSVKDWQTDQQNSEDMDSRDELRERELEEARARAAQMEKTMRWWSDCTANWREKWGKVRAERNKSREETRQLKLKLDSVAKEILMLKREKQEAFDSKVRLEREVEKLEKELKKDKRLIPSARVEPSLKDSTPVGNIKTSVSDSVYDKTVPKPGDEQQFIAQILRKNELYEGKLEHGDKLFEEGAQGRRHSIPAVEERKKRSHSARHWNQLRTEDGFDTDFSESVSVLTVELERSKQLLADEKSFSAGLQEEIDSLQADIQSMKVNNEELVAKKGGALSELANLKDKYEKDVGNLKANLEEAYALSSSTGSSIKIKELRVEIERLQAENTQEWSKRDKLESEKIGLERENKKLKLRIEDLESQLSEKSSKPSDVGLRQLQQELDEANGELQETKYAYNRTRKQLQEKSEELSHSKKRTEQHESEVKKLRIRVEELKLDLAKAEDELDEEVNNSRRMQRSLDEQKECAESYKVQVEHLTSRLRATEGATSSKPRFLSKHKGSRQLSSEDSDEESVSL